MRRHLTRASVVLAGVVASLLLGMTATVGGKTAPSSVKIRPIEDFLDAQGKNLNGFPAPLNSTAWGDPTTGLFMAVDYAGLVNQWIEEQSGGAISLGTEIDGTIIERPLPDGRAEVTVLLRTKNAFMVVAPLDDPLSLALFGHHAWDVAAGAEPALGESLLKWVFINDAPGAPLPDFCDEANPFPPAPEPHEWIMLSFEAQAEGTLREEFGVLDGTPGRAQATQIGLFDTAGEGEPNGRWPTEHIKLQVVGH